MPFARPDLATLSAQTLADIQSKLPGVDPLLEQAVLNILGVTLAEAFSSQYGYLDWIARQAVPFTAVDEAFAAWAALKGEQQKPATAASGTWTFAAPVDGRVIPADSVITRSDGAGYKVLADAVSAGGSVVASVVAQLAGSAGTIANGVSGVLSIPVAGVASSGTGAAGVAGADVEVFGDFKTRVLAKYANPPQGGSAADYVTWAEGVAGVTRAWCRPLGMGAGTVVVYVMMDQAEAAFGGFPQGTGGVATGEARDAAATGDQLAVANALFPLQPAEALVYVRAPGQNTANFTINLPGASADLKAAINAAIDAALLQTVSVGGARLANGVAGGVTPLSLIEGVIAAVTGAGGFVITAIACDHGAVAPGSTGNITASVGYLTVRGATTWTG